MVDLPANTTTSGVVEVGGDGARSTIYKPIFVERTGGNDVDGYEFDTDWFAVELKERRTYRIDMKGYNPTNGFTLRLPQINAIYDADGESLVNTFSRDESSAHHLFRVTFHAHANGTHYIAASGESFEWGYYELTVKKIKSSSKPAVADGPPGLAPNPDFDGDGTVGFADFLQFAGKFGLSRSDARFDARYDLDGDGTIGFGDFLIFASAFGRNT